MDEAVEVPLESICPGSVKAGSHMFETEVVVGVEPPTVGLVAAGLLVCSLLEGDGAGGSTAFD